MSAASRVVLVALAAALVVAACTAESGPADERGASSATSPTVAPTESAPDDATDAAPTSPSDAAAPGSGAVPAPEWLGTRVLSTGANGFAVPQPTPQALVDRRFLTPDHLPRPDEVTFDTTVESVPAAVLARSTWTDDCPVTPDELRYVTVTFWGFDGWVHRGELLVNEDAVDATIAGFEALFAQRFPIEEMRIIAAEELDVPPTGDGNVTTAFVCRPSRGATSWSEHAFGRAIDINPFHNPYVHDEVVLPELATAYVDRADVRPGMLTDASVVGFVESGWGWGGRWESLLDYMHVSANGR